MITKKKILSLISLAIILVIVSVACKKNPTNAADYMVAKQAEQSPQPEKKLTIDTNQGLIQFKDLSFKSGAYYINGNYTRKIYYYADVKVDENSKPYISAITKSEDGEIIEDEGKFYVMSNESGTFYKLSGVRYQSVNTLTADATFTESGYLIIRFSNYSLDITYSLITNSKIGTYVPQEYLGKYYDLSRGPIAIVTVNSISLYDSDGGSFLYTVDVSDSKTTYLGDNTWHYYHDSHNNGDDSTIKFKRNENGQRVLLENPLGYEYTFVHEDDINK